MADVDQVLLCAELMQHVAEVHRRAAAQALDHHGVGESAAGLVWLLGTRGPTSMGSVAQFLACDPSNVTLLAASLEGLGLAQRVADPADGRRRLVQLTARGRQAHTDMVEAVHTASPLTGLTARDMAALTAALQPLVDTSLRPPASFDACVQP